MSDFEVNGELPNEEEFFRVFWGRVREYRARKAAGEPVDSPEEEEYQKQVLDFVDTIPTDLTEDELIEYVINSNFPLPPDDDIIYDFRSLN